MPNAPVTPATTPHHNDQRGGKGSRVSHANRSMKSKPQACAPATTRNTLARLVAMPPAKSPPPQTAAAPKLRAAPVTVPRFMKDSCQWPVASCQRLDFRARVEAHHLILEGRMSNSSPCERRESWNFTLQIPESMMNGKS